MSQEKTNFSKYSSRVKSSAGAPQPLWISQARAEKFLVEMMNLKIEDQEARSRFWKRFADLMPVWFRKFALTLAVERQGITFPLAPGKMDELVQLGVFDERGRLALELPSIEQDAELEEACKGLLHVLRLYLSQAWSSTSTFARQFQMLIMATRYLHLGSEPMRGQSQPAYQRLVKESLPITPDLLPANEPWSTFIDTALFVDIGILTDPFLPVLLRGLQVADRMRVCGNPTCPAPFFIAARRSQKYCSDACALPAQREFKRTWWAEHGGKWRADRTERVRAADAKNRPKKPAKKRGK